MNIRVSKDWFDRYNVESIPLADGSGYVAQLVVYHELHCLVRNPSWNVLPILLTKPCNWLEETKTSYVPRVVLQRHFAGGDGRRRVARRHVDSILLFILETNSTLGTTEHCLELLRVASLCRSDTTLTTFQWGGPNGTKLETEYPIPHQCIDHEKVLGWSKAHAVDIGKKGILRFWQSQILILTPISPTFYWHELSPHSFSFLFLTSPPKKYFAKSRVLNAL